MNDRLEKWISDQAAKCDPPLGYLAQKHQAEFWIRKFENESVELKRELLKEVVVSQ